MKTKRISKIVGLATLVGTIFPSGCSRFNPEYITAGEMEKINRREYSENREYSPSKEAMLDFGDLIISGYLLK